MSENPTYTTFHADKRVASGDLSSMLRATKAYLDANPQAQLLIFNEATGSQVDYDFRGTADEVAERYAPQEEAKGPGRPRLGVVSREVTLLPRHWDWLAEQPSGASATLRRLVDEARRNEDPAERARRVTGRVMTALAGDLQNYEEAYRALDGGAGGRFWELTADWPADVRAYLLRLGAPALAGE